MTRRITLMLSILAVLLSATAAWAACTPTAITPYIQVNGGSWQQTASVTVSTGATVVLGPQPAKGGSWSWSGPNGYTSTARQISLTISSTSIYTATYTNTTACKSTQKFTLTVPAPTPTPTQKPTATATPTATPAATPNEIQVENARAGTSTWRLTDPAASSEIEGYASLTSVEHGGAISFYVNTADPTYTIDVFRMGWYGGLGARQVAGPIQQTGTKQIIPTPDPSTGLVDCNWINPYTLTTSTSWVSGIYLARLTGSSGKQSYIIFAVREDERPSDYLYQSSFTTYQAYNNWGGKSLYTFNSTGNINAQKVSFNRPYGTNPWNSLAAQGTGAGEFITNEQPLDETPSVGFEYNMVRFLEREGYDVTYSTSVDTHESGEALMHHKGFLSNGHDEYWSWAMRNHVEAARNRGVNLAFFASNVCYWQIRFEPSVATGAADRVIVAYKGTTDPVYADPNTAYLTTDEWRSAEVNRSEDAMVGVMFVIDHGDGTYNVDVASNWAFANTGLKNGDQLVGLAGYEVDQIFDGGHSPAGTILLANAPVNGGAANMVTYKSAASNATVFATGSQWWSWGLDDDYSQPSLRSSLLSAPAQQITRNVLVRFKTALPPVTFADTFNTASMNANNWTYGVIDEGVGAYNPAIPIHQVSSQLQISPLTGSLGDSFAGYDSANVWDLTGGSATVKVVQTTAVASAADTIFALATDDMNWYRIVEEQGGLYFQQIVNGVRTTVGITYDPTQDKWWRIQHIAASDSMVWETSPDGTTWTTQMTQPRQLDIVGLRVELQAGTYESESTPGMAVFSNFTLVP